MLLVSFIDKAHRIFKQNHLHEEIPRDVLMRIHYFHIKEKVMLLARHMGSLPQVYAQISLYTDISLTNAPNRKQFQFCMIGDSPERLA